MSTDGTRIEIRGIPVEIVRKDIKNLHLGVYPPEGRVRVAVPLRLDDDAVRMAVISRLAWIRRKQAEFEGQDRQSRREFVTGESHYFEGRRYRLDVVVSGGPTGIRLRGNRWIEMRVRPETGRDAREAMLYRWYRDRLRERIPDMIAKWEPRIGVTVAEWRVRRMKTRWGTCNREAGRIWLNSELAKKPVSCLEYVVVHEMVHLIERGHNERFRGILDRVMPGWGGRVEELNRGYLASEEWRQQRIGPEGGERSVSASLVEATNLPNKGSIVLPVWHIRSGRNEEPNH